MSVMADLYKNMLLTKNLLWYDCEVGVTAFSFKVLEVLFYDNICVEFLSIVYHLCFKSVESHSSQLLSN